MSKIPPRISRKDAIFDPYVCDGVDYLNSISSGITKHFERLGVSSSRMTALTDLRNQWRTVPPDPPGLYQRKTALATKGTLATQLSNKLKKDIIAAFQPILDTIAASENILLFDYNQFNIAIPKDSIHYMTEKITDITHVSTKIIGNEEIEITLKTNDSKRAGIGPLADSYEVAMCIVNPNFEQDAELAGHIRKTPPKNYNECIWRQIIKKAKFIETFDPVHRSCDVHIYARNYHTSYPLLAGPWSEVCIEVIP